MATVNQKYKREVVQCDKCGRFESDFFEVRHCLSNGVPLDLCEVCLSHNKYCVCCHETENILEMYNTGDYIQELPRYYCKEHYQQRMVKMFKKLKEQQEEYNLIAQNYNKFFLKL